MSERYDDSVLRIRDALKLKPLRQPGEDYDPRPEPPDEYVGGQSTVYGNAKPKPPLSSEIEAILQEIRLARGGLDSTGATSVCFKTAEELFTVEDPTPLWLIQGILPVNGVCVIAGEPKATKTWSAIEMGLAVATGCPAFGEFQTPQGPGNVALYLVEDSRPAIRSRLKSLAVTKLPRNPLGAWVKRLHYESRHSLDITDDLQLAGLIQACRKLGSLSMLVLDPLRDLHNADEDKSTPMSVVMGQLIVLRDLLRCAIVFVHHTAKANQENSKRSPGQNMRGSSVIHAKVDAGFYMTNTETDQVSWWENKVTVQLKEGRGAGVFRLRLEVEDDKDERAERAEWTKSDVEDAPRGRRPVSDDDVQQRILATLNDMPQGVNSIAKAASIHKSKVRTGACALVAKGYAQALEIGGREQWVITNSGKIQRQ